MRSGEFDAIDAAFLAAENDGAPQVAGDGPHFYVALSPWLFEVLDLELEVGRSFSVEYTPSATHLEELENGFRWTGKLAAQAIDGGGIVSVSLNGREFLRLDAAKAVKALQSDDPPAALANLATE